MEEVQTNIIRPQEGYQMKFLSSPADIVVGGGAAGVGKTYSLLLEPVRFYNTPGFGSVIFRRTSPQIRNEGGLWDTSMNIYSMLGAIPRQSSLEWIFSKDVKLKFSHLEYDKNVYDYQGAQIPFIGFDELTHFTKKMFFYMLTRNRSVCGVKPYVRATCNPDPDSWVADLIAWWIDQETGFAIPERDGILRYFVVDGDNYIWGDTKQEVIANSWHIIGEVVEKSGINPDEFIKSITFISGNIYDNKELLKVDPAYLGNLLSQPKDVQAALLHSNWKTVVSDNDLYDYPSFLGMFTNSYDVSAIGRYITADIAMKGSNKFIAGYWEGDTLQDLIILDKSNGKQVVDAIKELARRYQVQNQHILFDNDGVGSFVDGFIEGAVEFNNGARAMNDENYFNLKTQCYYKSADWVLQAKYKVSEHVANMMYDEKMTVRQRFMYERKAIRRDKTDMDGKLKMLGKDKMKPILGGDSPDLMDMFMMRKYFDLAPVVQAVTGSLGMAMRGGR